MYYNQPYWNNKYFKHPYWHGTQVEDNEIKIKQTGRWVRQHKMDDDILEILAAIIETRILE
jgi:hypothetical protein